MIIDCGQNGAPQRVMLQAFVADDDSKRGPHEPPWFVHVHLFPHRHLEPGAEVVTGYLVHVDDLDLSLQEADPSDDIDTREGTPATSIDIDDIETVYIP